MFNAKEARKAYEVRMNEVKEAKRVRALEVCEELGKEIEQASNNLRTTYNAKAIDADIVAMVVENLEYYGYKVHRHNDRTLNITW